MTDEEFLQASLKLIEQRIRSADDFAAEVLFHLERGCDGWTPEDAVDCLFRYATNWGWGED